jgi:hypothetical protein
VERLESVERLELMERLERVERLTWSASTIREPCARAIVTAGRAAGVVAEGDDRWFDRE